jgi:hypothetical protein
MPSADDQPAGRGAAGGKDSLWRDLVKAVVMSIIGGVLGYIGVFFVPPEILYDRCCRPDQNAFAGKWVGAVGGWGAALRLREVAGSGTDLEGELTVDLGDRKHRVLLTGNHDSKVFLQGPWDGRHQIKIGLDRAIGTRFSADSDLLMLVQPDRKYPAVILCPPNSLDVTQCQPFYDGTAFLSMRPDDAARAQGR